MVRRYGYEKELFFVAGHHASSYIDAFFVFVGAGCPRRSSGFRWRGNFTLVTQNGDLYTWGVGENGYAEGLP